VPSGRTYSRRIIAATIIALVLPVALPAAASDASTVEFVFPQNAAVTQFTSSFGDARSGGRSHKGNDLMAPKLTPVYAIADGTVTMIREGGLAGRWIAIEHEDGWESWYMHLNNDTPGTDDGHGDWGFTIARGISVGERVVAGQLIGFSGDSGNAEPSSPHTHFELHRNGSAVNPYPYLRDAYERALVKIADVIIPAFSRLLTEMGSQQLRPARSLG
jgi:murein DD-endopeptidase MepM/ murein hydrolase activator NlpD